MINIFKQIALIFLLDHWTQNGSNFDIFVKVKADHYICITELFGYCKGGTSWIRY